MAICPPAPSLRRLLPLLFVTLLLAFGSKVAGASSAYCGIFIDAVGIQSDPQVVPDGANGFYVAYLDTRFGTQGISIRRIDAHGQLSPGWPAEGVAVTAHALHFTLEVDGAGGAFVVWVSLPIYTDYGWVVTHARLQRVLPEGSIAAGWPSDGFWLDTFNAPTPSFYEYGHDFSIATDGKGGVYVAWSTTSVVREPSYRTSSWAQVERISGGGAVVPGWMRYRSTMIDESALRIELVPRAGGVIAMQWTDFYGGLIALRILPDGSSESGSEAIRSTSCALWDARAISNGAGGAFSTWTNRGCMGEVELAQMLADGSVPENWGPSKLVAGPSMNATGLETDGAGGVFVSWTDGTTPRVIRYGPDGSPVPGWEGGVPLTTGPGTHSSSQITPDGHGGVYAIWVDEGSGIGILYGQHILAIGTPSPLYGAQGQPICQGGIRNPHLANDALGRGVVAWYDEGATFISVTLMTEDGVTETQISAIRFEMHQDRVSIVWQTNSHVPMNYEVERASDGGAWQPVGFASSDDLGDVAHEDDGVTAGRRYGYRLRERTADRAWEASEIWIDVPAGVALAIRSSTFDNAGGELAITITLAAAGGSLELFDPMGRRVLSRRLDGMEPGDHRVTLGAMGAIPVGIYHARLRQGDQHATRAVAHVR